MSIYGKEDDAKIQKDLDPYTGVGRLLEMETTPTYTHLFTTIRLLIFRKKSHLYFY